MRAVVYARYSSDHQREASIEDQVRLCRARIEAEGWSLVHAYTDRAISGASVFRPAYQELLQDARAGAFEVIVAESLDRLSRDQADVASLYKHLAYRGIRMVTLAEGEISELHVGLKGTMNALYLKDLAAKTRRGLEGRVRAGRSAGGLCYGYDVVAAGGDDNGHRRVNAAEAAVVRRVFREFAAGRSPRSIARQLNAERMPGPHGRQWRDSAIRGHLERGTGLLNNELYIGRLVWNRLRYVKDPETGRRRSRRNPPEEWIVEEVPQLRIVDDELWRAVKARQGAIRGTPAVQKARASEFWKRRRPRHLLTGLVVCGSCGSRFAAMGRDYLACSAARGRGTCDNRRSIRRAGLEGLILEALKHNLMRPELVEEFIAEFHAEINRQRARAEAEAKAKARELADVQRRLDGLVDAIADGLRGEGLQAKLSALEDRKARLEAEIAAAPAPAPRLHPRLAGLYRDKVTHLQEALGDPQTRDEALDILHGLIERVEMHPADDGYEVELVGEIARMVEVALHEGGVKQAALGEKAACSVKVVAGARNQLYLLFAASRIPKLA